MEKREAGESEPGLGEKRRIFVRLGDRAHLDELTETNNAPEAP